jgi:hypothetical protein
MRAALIFFELLLSVSGPAFAQEWAPYQNIEDGRLRPTSTDNRSDALRGDTAGARPAADS